jgi:hypothetical protein
VQHKQIDAGINDIVEVFDNVMWGQITMKKVKEVYIIEKNFELKPICTFKIASKIRSSCHRQFIENIEAHWAMIICAKRLRYLGI